MPRLKISFSFFSFLNSRNVSVQEGSTGLGSLLLDLCRRFTLSCIYSGLCSGGFLHGLCDNIYCQFCTTIHQPQTKGSCWKYEGEGWIENATCEIQHIPLSGQSGVTLDLKKEKKSKPPQQFYSTFSEKKSQQRHVRWCQHQLAFFFVCLLVFFCITYRYISSCHIILNTTSCLMGFNSGFLSEILALDSVQNCSCCCVMQIYSPTSRWS